MLDLWWGACAWWRSEGGVRARAVVTTRNRKHFTSSRGLSRALSQTTMPELSVFLEMLWLNGMILLLCYGILWLLSVETSDASCSLAERFWGLGLILIAVCTYNRHYLFRHTRYLSCKHWKRACLCALTCASGTNTVVVVVVVGCVS